MQTGTNFSRVIMPVLSVELRWKSKTGMTYQIEESADLIRWQPAVPTQFIGTGTEITWTAPPAAGGKRSYRVRES